MKKFADQRPWRQCWDRYPCVEKQELHDNKDILIDAVKDFQYGSVTVHIQDGKIVYIERTEKIKIKG